MVTHQLQVERRAGKVRRPETDVLPLSHATNLKVGSSNSISVVKYSMLRTFMTSCLRNGPVVLSKRIVGKISKEDEILITDVKYFT